MQIKSIYCSSFSTISVLVSFSGIEIESLWSWVTIKSFIYFFKEVKFNFWLSWNISVQESFQNYICSGKCQDFTVWRVFPGQHTFSVAVFELSSVRLVSGNCSRSGWMPEASLTQPSSFFSSCYVEFALILACVWERNHFCTCFCVITVSTHSCLAFSMFYDV